MASYATVSYSFNRRLIQFMLFHWCDVKPAQVLLLQVLCVTTSSTAERHSYLYIYRLLLRLVNLFSYDVI